jgi:hypothetical protein
MTRKKHIVLALIITAAAAPLFAGFADDMYKADLLDLQGRYQDEEDLLARLLSVTRDDAQLAEVYWRLARTYLQFGQELQLAGGARDKMLKLFEQGAGYADTAVKMDSGNAMGYFWKAANVGRWGQVKGIIESLQKANEMKDLLYISMSYDPSYPGTYYLLGQLYDQVPGWPLGFGDLNYAVSMARKAVDANEMNLKNGTYPYKYYDMYIELASYLWKRNWDANKRAREQAAEKKKYSEKSSTLEKYCYYEGVVTLANESDRGEARMILRRCAAELEKISPRYPFQEKALEKAYKFLADWK